MSLAAGPGRELPAFTPSFPTTNPVFYFHHIVDADDATLTVEVLGPNLGFTFTHKRTLPRSTLEETLTKKTVGFLAFVGNQQRLILALSESGHGCGRLGDILDIPSGPAQSPVIPNTLWTRRAIHLANILGVNFATPFDHPGRHRGTEQERAAQRGIYHGGHVEVKLATYAICAMLELFGITDDFGNMTRQHLERLKNASCTDGIRPCFEIYFSRKNCPRCGKFAKALEDITGISIALCWKDRLVKMVYPKKKIRSRSLYRNQTTEAGSGAEQVVIDVDDLENDDDEVYDAEEEGDEDIMAIDLTLDPATIDLTSDAALTTPEPRAGNDEAVDDYVSGLAYCVGQFGQSATPARNAIIDLARLMQNRQRLREPASVRKPLPATAETHCPDFLLGQPVQSTSTSTERTPANRGILQTPPTTMLREMLAQSMGHPLSPPSSEVPFDQASLEDGSSSDGSIPSFFSLHTPPPSDKKNCRMGEWTSAVGTPSKAPRGKTAPDTFHPKICENTAIQGDEDITTGWLDAPSPF